ncbi:hypothetical protein BofuT4_P010800.1 [Botrytis cinerea T4]|uniref:Uncharacterized protein n=1 Tax=Botryotinia fuckeliana (strain T4) TaxID=999810 RepID=G2XTB8_BOTF4|nr:hypothetical protein BofuT4_P010800.1 [Botrytis cinerea T4]
MPTQYANKSSAYFSRPLQIHDRVAFPEHGLHKDELTIPLILTTVENFLCLFLTTHTRKLRMKITPSKQFYKSLHNPHELPAQIRHSPVAEPHLRRATLPQNHHLGKRHVYLDWVFDQGASLVTSVPLFSTPDVA